jgi:hypothetical protein
MSKITFSQFIKDANIALKEMRSSDVFTLTLLRRELPKSVKLWLDIRIFIARIFLKIGCSLLYAPFVYKEDE